MNHKSGVSDRIVSVITLAQSTSTYTTTATKTANLSGRLPTQGVIASLLKRLLPPDFKSLNILFEGPEYPHPANSTLTPQLLNVTIQCDSESMSEPRFLSYDGSTLNLEWSAPDVCPKDPKSEPPKGDKGGSDDGPADEENVGSGIGWFFLV